MLSVKVKSFVFLGKKLWRLPQKLRKKPIYDDLSHKYHYFTYELPFDSLFGPYKASFMIRRDLGLGFMNKSLLLSSLILFQYYVLK